MAIAMNRIGWALIILGAVVMFLLAAQYFYWDLDAKAADPENALRDLYLNRRVGLYIHVFAMMVPLIIGPVQFFLRRLTPGTRRAEYLPLHRWLGRTYVTGTEPGVRPVSFLKAFRKAGSES